MGRVAVVKAGEEQGACCPPLPQLLNAHSQLLKLPLLDQLQRLAGPLRRKAELALGGQHRRLASCLLRLPPTAATLPLLLLVLHRAGDAQQPLVVLGLLPWLPQLPHSAPLQR